MNFIEIILDAEYSSRPAKIKILCNNDEIFNGIIKSKKIISHNPKLKEGLEIKVSKFGKTKDLVDAGHKQIITIDKVTLNGIDLKIDAFGMFSTKDNAYVKDKELQTTTLTLNGEWSLSIPSTYSLPGHLTTKGKKLKNKFIDSDVSCFGASNTNRKDFKCWPHYLAKLSKVKVENYGISGSSWPEITRLVQEYSRSVKDRDIIILSPHCFRFQIRDEEEWLNSNDWDFLKREVVLHGEEHYVAVLSANLCDFFDKISESNNIYICPDNKSEYDLFQKTPLKKYIVPDVEFPDNQLEQDGHWNDKWNITFAEKIARHLSIF